LDLKNNVQSFEYSAVGVRVTNKASDKIHFNLMLSKLAFKEETEILTVG
jgi:hypothetical protein